VKRAPCDKTWKDVRRLTIFALALALGDVSARADDVLAPRYVSAPFWESVRTPEAPRVRALLRQGRARLSPALGIGLLFGSEAAVHRRAGIESALARFERALALAPEDPECLLLTGKALAQWERRGPDGSYERRTQEAIALFERLRELAPLYEAEEVSFELGVLYTREYDFARATEAYERALALRMGKTSRSALLGNLAEVSMMREDLERALALYEQAVAEGQREERVLHLWGWAVALDRVGEKAESLERAKQALREDHKPLSALHHSSVFFAPEYEAHYYDGLGYRALAELSAGEHGQAEHLVRSFPRTLQRASSKSQLAALKQLLTSLDEAGHRALAEPLYGPLERALHRLAPARAKLGQLDAGTPPQDAALEVLLLSVQSLQAFARYLDQGGDAGPWAADARAHIQEIASWLGSRPPRGEKPLAGARRR
jgi:tetratricopeptide (TPR) repeat protein